MSTANTNFEFNSFANFNSADDENQETPRNLKPEMIVLNRFRLLEKIGRGGMSEIWKAHDMTSDIDVALKFVPRDIQMYSTEMKRVKDTYALIHDLTHPNICPTYYLENDPVHGYFLVIKWLEGQSLEEMLLSYKDGFPRELILPILKPIAAALDYAHSQGVVHRDIKPSNIFIRMDATGQKIQNVWLFDFGLATEIRQSLSRVSQAPVGTSGTRAYMPPEQWRGRKQDAQTDQYSLGVVAYELYSGSVPFIGDDVEIQRLSILNDAPEDISGVDARINNAILRALSKEKADRFESCTAFVDALDVEKATRPVNTTSRPVNTTTQNCDSDSLTDTPDSLTDTENNTVSNPNSIVSTSCQKFSFKATLIKFLLFILCLAGIVFAYWIRHLNFFGREGNIYDSTNYAIEHLLSVFLIGIIMQLTCIIPKWIRDKRFLGISDGLYSGVIFWILGVVSICLDFAPDAFGIIPNFVLSGTAIWIGIIWAREYGIYSRFIEQNSLMTDNKQSFRCLMYQLALSCPVGLVAYIFFVTSGIICFCGLPVFPEPSELPDSPDSLFIVLDYVLLRLVLFVWIICITLIIPMRYFMRKILLRYYATSYQTENSERNSEQNN